eukprot:TRINITY_DN5008_c0_g1_i1.p1 TRINITY_DN5008_c0_g1~~TRINITY_DN5008_c0_g1_i1.p1  ORF type:complete len:125 (-),score=37.05 TRINITY_DN5008_c0_g1_i1:163-537(-)
MRLEPNQINETEELDTKSPNSLSIKDVEVKSCRKKKVSTPSENLRDNMYVEKQYDPYHVAKKQFVTIQHEKEEKAHEIREKKKQHKERRREKVMRGKRLAKRTGKGQPILGIVAQDLIKKLEKP